MNVLITGGNSFLAKHLLPLLVGNNITLFSRKSSFLPGDNVSEIEYTMNDPHSSINNLSIIPEIALLFAWDGTRGKKRNNLILQFFNYYYTCNLVSELIRLGTRKYFLAGSQAEYYSAIFSPHFSWYGFFKKQTQKWLEKKALSVDGLNYIEGRFFSIYGPGDYNQSLIIHLLSHMILNKEVNLTCANNIWNYLYVKDAAKVIQFLISDKNTNGIYDIASENSLVLKSYIETIKLLLDSKSKLNYCHFKTEHMSKNLNPNLNPIIDLIGHYEEFTFEEGMRETISFYIEGLNYEV